ncbi:substrate-binding periplasmic protein [Teredinibacter franksiae]|uniref:substrate-binding periplasmic protein n=1 Tax=Teredinibacter franksiae TaxID=2761453 RepID=UPI00162A7B92|nr:transporter substrate-binding domain-containing protein [Teredinibacter franksiae]
MYSNNRFIRPFIFYLFACCSLLLSLSANAIERVTALPDMGTGDARQVYFAKLLRAALATTEDEFGPYELVKPDFHMSSQRMMMELLTGDNLSVGLSPYKIAWEGKTHIVPVPLIRGLASYRLFLASKKSEEKLAQVQHLNDLRQLKIGQGQGWSTAKILTDHKLSIVYAASYRGMFKMLEAGRFDLLMRSPHEIISEKAIFSSAESNITIEKRFAIYSYLPYYFHVTLKNKVLAKRLEQGIKSLYASGEVDNLLTEHFDEAIELVLMPHKKIFYLENTNLPQGVFERDKPYLMTLEIPKTPISRNLSP